MIARVSPSCSTPERCAPKSPLRARALIAGETARDVAALFRILSSDTRVTILHALVRVGESCVSQLAETVGLKPQAVSNQLQRLVDRGILAQRREGTFIHYRLADPCVADLLDRGMCLLEDARTRVEQRDSSSPRRRRSARRP